MFGKKLQIGEGDKYDFTKVSTSEVTREEIVKKNNRLIDIFKHFDTDKDGKLNSAEMAKAMEAIDSFDTSGNDKLSKKELQKAAEGFNEAYNLTGDDKIKAKDFKEFIKNMFTATKGDEMTDTQKVLAEYEKQQAALKEQEFWANVDKAAEQYGFEPTKNEGVYWSEQEKMYAKYDAENKSLRYAKWNNETQEFEFMTDEEINAARAANQDPVEKEEETPELHKYTVQPGESFTAVIKKSLAAQGIENPTDEQIAKAKEQFKKDNPDAVKTNKNGYEFLDVGAEVQLPADIKSESDLSAEEAEIAWAKANPNLVSEAWIKDHPDVKLNRTSPANGEDPVDPQGGDPKAKGNGDLNNEELRAGNDLAQKAGYRETDCEGIYYDNDNKQHYKYNPETGKLEKFEADHVNMLGAYRVDEKDDSGNVTGSKYYDKNGNEISTADYNEIQSRSDGIKSISKIIDPDYSSIAAAKDKETLKANEEYIKKSNLSLARVVDMVENEPDNVTFTKGEDGSEYAELPDGTGIMITRDDDGNIDMVEIFNPGGPDSTFDIRYRQKGTMYFDPDGKNVDSSKYKESIQGGFDFAKIKALAERIFGAKPKEE